MNKEGLGAGDGGDLGQGTTRAVLGSRKRFPNGSSAYFDRGPRIAYRNQRNGSPVHARRVFLLQPYAEVHLINDVLVHSHV